MGKFSEWFDEMHNERWHELMTNQLYTAVLGSIIYMLFDWGYTILNSTVPIDSYYDILIRTSFLLIGIVFYISDFYYIKNTNPYRKWYFLFDLLFMICMLYSAKLLNVEIGDNNLNQLPAIEFKKLIFSYGIFLILYLIWDFRELIWVKKKNKDQVLYYYEVILWEVFSIIGLLLVFKNCNEIKLLFVLSLSTLWFCFISYRKLNHKSSEFAKLIQKKLNKK